MAVSFEPGDLVRRFAALHGWPVKERTVFVEGEHDQRYFSLADALYCRESGLCLLGTRLAAFPAGIGGEGGAFGLQRHFHPLRANMDCDVTQDSRRVFHLIALFDNDNEGRRGASALTGQHLNYRMWRDVFVLHRVIPRTTRDSIHMAKLVQDANEKWRGMDCEIEDLLSVNLIEAFLAEKPNGAKGFQQRDGGIHCTFNRPLKAELVRFVETHALLRDVDRIVDLLKSLRYHVGLPPDGDPELQVRK